MRLTKNQLQKIEKFAKTKLDYLNWQHTQKIRPIAKKLSKLEGADEKIVDVAVLLHDIAKGKVGIWHGIEGSKIAKKFLNKLNLKKEDVDKICHAIALHDEPWRGNSRKLDTAETKVLFDADMVQQFSELGIAKYFHYLFNKNFKRVLVDSEKVFDKAYKLIITKNGKKLAQPGYKFVKDFFENIKK